MIKRIVLENYMSQARTVIEPADGQSQSDADNTAEEPSADDNS